MIDFAVLRTHMVDSQVRTGGVTDHRIIAAFAAVARELFVPPERRAVAYVDDDLLIKPAALGTPARFLMEPMVLARLLELAEIRPGDVILDVGCATGYGAAILARLGGTVIALDEDQALVKEAKSNLASLANVRVREGRHAEGSPADAPFDAIVIAGKVPLVPPSLLAQLKPDGRLVAMVGRRDVATAMLFIRHGEAASSVSAFEAGVKPLPGLAVEGPAFVF